MELVSARNDNVKKNIYPRQISQKLKFGGQTLKFQKHMKISVCIKYLELGCSVGSQNRGPRSTGVAAKQKKS